MIKQALSVLPTRPVVFIVPAIVVLVMSFYYWDRYDKCAAIKLLRDSITEALRGRVNRQVKLAEVTQFGWDGVRIVTEFKPGKSAAGCPFGWNWAGAEREALIDSGGLIAMIFVQHEKMVGYVELSAREVNFLGVGPESISPAASFAVTRGQGFESVVLSLEK